MSRSIGVQVGLSWRLATFSTHVESTHQPVANHDSNWLLDREKGLARLAKPTEALKNFAVPLRPILGCVGVAPPGHMVFRTGFPGSFGGNMDYNRLREGVTLCDQSSAR